MFSSKFVDDTEGGHPPYILRNSIKNKYKYEGYSIRGIVHQLQRTFTENLHWAKQ